MLHSDYLTHVGLQEQVSRLIEPVVETMMISLVESCPDSHPWVAVAVYLAHKLCNLLLRVLENVDRLERLSKVLSFGLDPLSDLLINYVVLVVEILKLDDGDSGPEHV